MSHHNPDRFGWRPEVEIEAQRSSYHDSAWTRVKQRPAIVRMLTSASSTISQPRLTILSVFRAESEARLESSATCCKLSAIGCIESRCCATSQPRSLVATNPGAWKGAFTAATRWQTRLDPHFRSWTGGRSASGPAGYCAACPASSRQDQGPAALRFRQVARCADRQK